MTQHTPQDSQSELTPDQYLRFKVLVPFHSAMEKKRREDKKLGYIQDASGIYSEAIELIEAYVTTRVKEAVDNYHNEITANETKVWISKGDFEQRLKEAERLARISERKSVALDNYSGHTFSDDTNWKGKFQKFIDNNERRIEALTTTTNGKELEKHE